MPRFSKFSNVVITPSLHEKQIANAIAEATEMHVPKVHPMDGGMGAVLAAPIAKLGGLPHPALLGGLIGGGAGALNHVLEPVDDGRSLLRETLVGGGIGALTGGALKAMHGGGGAAQQLHGDMFADMFDTIHTASVAEQRKHAVDYEIDTRPKWPKAEELQDDEDTQSLVERGRVSSAWQAHDAAVTAQLGQEAGFKGAEDVAPEAPAEPVAVTSETPWMGRPPDLCSYICKTQSAERCKKCRGESFMDKASQALPPNAFAHFLGKDASFIRMKMRDGDPLRDEEACECEPQGNGQSCRFCLKRRPGGSNDPEKTAANPWHDLSPVVRRMLIGGAGGAAVGGIGGALSDEDNREHNALIGAVGGGAIGALGGHRYNAAHPIIAARGTRLAPGLGPRSVRLDYGGTLAHDPLVSPELNEARRQIRTASEKTAASALRKRFKLTPRTGFAGQPEGFDAHIGNTPAGVIAIDHEGKVPAVGAAMLEEKFRGMGLGRKMYGEAMRRMPDGVLNSGTSVAPAANGVFDKLKQNKGYEVKTNPKTVIDAEGYRSAPGYVHSAKITPKALKPQPGTLMSATSMLDDVARESPVKSLLGLAAEAKRVDPFTSAAQKSIGVLRKRPNTVSFHPSMKFANDPIKKKLDVCGVPIHLEWLKGDDRVYKGPKPFKKHMTAHYGYIPNTLDSDGEELDVYVGPDAEDCKTVYVVNQLKANGKFDEHKVMVGYPSMAAAKASYLYHMGGASDRFGDITAIPFKSLVALYGKPDTQAKAASAVGYAEAMHTFGLLGEKTALFGKKKKKRSRREGAQLAAGASLLSMGLSDASSHLTEVPHRPRAELERVTRQMAERMGIKQPFDVHPSFTNAMAGVGAELGPEHLLHPPADMKAPTSFRERFNAERAYRQGRGPAPVSPNKINQPAVLLQPHVGEATIAHELGHLKNTETTLGGDYFGKNHSAGVAQLTAMPTLAHSILAENPGYLPSMLHGAISLPTLLEEGLASARGTGQLMRQHGALKGLGKGMALLPHFGTYAAAAALPALVTAFRRGDIFNRDDS